MSDLVAEIRKAMAQNPLPAYPLVFVRWRDSSSRSLHRWMSVEDMQDDEEPYECISIGWLVHESETWLVICPHIAPDAKHNDHDGIGEMRIPVAAVVERMELLAAG